MHVFSSKTTRLYQSPIGAFGIFIEENWIQRLHFIASDKMHIIPTPKAEPQDEDNPLLVSLFRALDGYFLQGNSTDLQNMAQYLNPNQGSAFDRRVWAFTRSIQPGHMCHYGEIARELTSAAQAVGQALKRNPCMLITPCHRVVGKHTLGGFMGKNETYQNIKSALLHLEHAL